MTFSFDAAGQLAVKRNARDQRITFAYDAAGQRRLLATVAVLVAALGCSSNMTTLGPRQDWWAEYQAGGVFETGSPSMSPDGETIVFASPRTGRLHLSGS